MAGEPSITVESKSVQSHLAMIQSVIQRMASNSASCKTWCITLVSAILVLTANKSRPEYVWIALIPIILFLALDTYYLSLEKQFRLSYNQFVKDLHEGSDITKKLYVIEPAGKIKDVIIKSLKSYSIWPFYTTLLVMLLIAEELFLKTSYHCRW